MESPDGQFESFPVHYAETFIVPEQVKRYTIRPYGKSEGEAVTVLKAYAEKPLERETLQTVDKPGLRGGASRVLREKEGK